MKIGIVTVHDSANFGSYLQAFALGQVLENKGHTVYFIRTRDQDYVKRLFVKRPGIRTVIRHPVRTVKAYFDGVKKRDNFLKDMAEFKEIDSPKEVKLDRIILGSDEIWNIDQPVFTKEVFYGIGMENVMTYGVSIGKSEINHFEEYPELLKAVKVIDHLLVRDERTVKMVKKYTDKKPETVVDPTLLLPIEAFYKPYKNDYTGRHKYILIYSYIIEAKLKECIVTFAKKMGLKIVSACFDYDWADHYINCSPLQFCEVLRQADYVVTTTFHGSIFSFLNHRQFVTIPFSPKTDDVLKKMGLESRLLTRDWQYEDFENRLLKERIDYDEVDQKVLKVRRESMALLDKYLVNE